MKVKEVIKNLGHLDPEAEIIHAWWDHDIDKGLEDN